VVAPAAGDRDRKPEVAEAFLPQDEEVASRIELDRKPRGPPGAPHQRAGGDLERISLEHHPKLRDDVEKAAGLQKARGPLLRVRRPAQPRFGASPQRDGFDLFILSDAGERSSQLAVRPDFLIHSLRRDAKQPIAGLEGRLAGPRPRDAQERLSARAARQLERNRNEVRVALLEAEAVDLGVARLAADRDPLLPAQRSLVPAVPSRSTMPLKNSAKDDAPTFEPLAGSTEAEIAERGAPVCRAERSGRSRERANESPAR
jgi:hypothetical protein